MTNYKEAKEYFEERLKDKKFDAAGVLATTYLRSVELSEALENTMKVCQRWSGCGQSSWWKNAVKAIGKPDSQRLF